MRDDSIPCCEPAFWAYLFVCMILISFAGITSGLALGLLSFSQVDLEVLIRAGKPQDQNNAAKIVPMVKNQHLLLCTLLVAKSLAMEALPIFLDTILPIWAAILVSVVLVVAFSEIIPQAVCSRYGLSIGAKSSTLVQVLLVLFYPIAFPISKFLDCLLGKSHPAVLRREELKTLVDLLANESGKGGELSHHETKIIAGALDLAQKTAKDAMTPISETFALNINSKLDMHTMGLIMSKGHSRIPVYSERPSNIIGLILVKNLIFSRPEDEVPIKYMTIRRIPRVYEDWPLYDILNQFQKGHSRMAIVLKSKKYVKSINNNAEGTDSRLDQTDPWSISIISTTSPLYSTDTEFLQSPGYKSVFEQKMYSDTQSLKRDAENSSFENLDSIPSNLNEQVVGIITMEDVLEELLQGEISDETIDEYMNVHNKIRINLQNYRTSLSRSPGQCSRAEPSPLSSYTPILRSPISPYFLPPLIRPTLSASPAKSTRVVS